MSMFESESGHLNLWAEGVSHEIDFWSRWVQDKGGYYSEDFKERMGGEKEFDSRLASLYPVGQDLKVLDVGAGPVSVLGQKCERNSVIITATDPLADAYDWIFESNNLQPPIRSMFSPAEDLNSYLPLNSFDLVHCRNALDHSFDPVRGIECMLAVCRPGGFVVLVHNTNVAIKEGYRGLHQYNFDGEEGQFIIWNEKYRCNVTSHLASSATVHFEPTANAKWHTVTIRKNASSGGISTTPLDTATELLIRNMRSIVLSHVAEASRIKKLSK